MLLLLRSSFILGFVTSVLAFPDCQRPIEGPMTILTSPPVERVCGSAFQILHTPVGVPFVLRQGMLPASDIQIKFGYINRLIADGHNVAQFITIKPESPQPKVPEFQAMSAPDTLLACLGPIKYENGATQRMMQGANYGIVEELAGPCQDNHYTSTLTVSLYSSPNGPASLNRDVSP